MYIIQEMSPRISVNRAFSSQDLALEARDIWLEWNRSIKESLPSDLPRPLTPEDELLTLCGVYHLADGPDLVGRYVENLRAMEESAPSFRNLQFIKVRVGKIAPKTIHVCFNIGYRIMVVMRNVSRHWAQSGPENTIFLTNSEMVPLTDFSTRAPESL